MSHDPFDLIPQASEFTIDQTGKTYRLRPISLADQLWITKDVGDVRELFEKQRIRELFRIVFHQLEIEDREDFKMRTVTFVNEEGESAQTKLGGVDLLLAMVRGTDEVEGILRALLRVMGASQPMIDEFDRASAEKKRVLRAMFETTSTGEASSTSSPTSTDGLRNIS